MEWADKSASTRLEQVCEKYLDDCPLYIKHIAVGDPAQEILKLIDNEKVVKNSPIPVTTIPIEAQSGFKGSTFKGSEVK